MAIGTLYKNGFLKAAFGDTHTADFPAIFYLQLYATSGPPSASGGGTPLSLARTQILNSDVWWTLQTGRVVNAREVFTAVASSDQPATQWFALHDHSTADRIVVWGRLLTATTLRTGRRGRFAPGAIVIPDR